MTPKDIGVKDLQQHDVIINKEMKDARAVARGIVVQRVHTHTPRP